MKIIFVTFLLTIFSLSAFSQEYDFVLKGHIKNIQNGKVKLIYDSRMQGVNLNDSAKVVNGFFEIKGELPNSYPYGTCLWLNDSIRTKLFFISAGTQTINLNANDFWVSPEMNTKAGKANENFKREMEPLMQMQRAYFSNRRKIVSGKYRGNPPSSVVDSLKTALEKLSLAKDSAVKNYIQNNPESYVGLWHLFDRLETMGYRPELEKAFQFFDDDLKHSALGTLTKNILRSSETMKIGSAFPTLPLKSSDGNSILFKPHKENKITLIDFWYSHCSPCISQFDDLKKFYSKYHSKGFEIVSISTDKKSQTKLWHQTISKYNLPWPQFLDADQVEALKLGVNVFPYNFVLNNNGRIMNKRVTMLQLKDILRKKFK